MSSIMDVLAQVLAAAVPVSDAAHQGKGLDRMYDPEAVDRRDPNRQPLDPSDPRVRRLTDEIGRGTMKMGSASDYPNSEPYPIVLGGNWGAGGHRPIDDNNFWPPQPLDPGPMGDIGPIDIPQSEELNFGSLMDLLQQPGVLAGLGGTAGLLALLSQIPQAATNAVLPPMPMDNLPWSGTQMQV